jgi:hypothetical protein
MLAMGGHICKSVIINKQPRSHFSPVYFKNRPRERQTFSLVVKQNASDQCELRQTTFQHVSGYSTWHQYVIMNSVGTVWGAALRIDRQWSAVAELTSVSKCTSIPSAHLGSSNPPPPTAGPHNLFPPYDPSYCYPPIPFQVFQVSVSRKASLPKFCIYSHLPYPSHIVGLRLYFTTLTTLGNRYKSHNSFLGNITYSVVDLEI